MLLSVEKPSHSAPNDFQITTPLMKWQTNLRKTAIIVPAIQPTAPFFLNIPATPRTV